MSQLLTIRRVRQGEAEAVAEVLARAFADDPAFEWLWRDDPSLGPKVTRAFFRTFASFALEAGEVTANDAMTGERPSGTR